MIKLSSEPICYKWIIWNTQQMQCQLIRKSKTNQLFEMHGFNQALNKATTSQIASITTNELYLLADKSFETLIKKRWVQCDFGQNSNQAAWVVLEAQDYSEYVIAHWIPHKKWIPEIQGGNRGRPVLHQKV